MAFWCREVMAAATKAERQKAGRWLTAVRAAVGDGKAAAVKRERESKIPAVAAKKCENFRCYH